jgi:hypothetical protein
MNQPQMTDHFKADCSGVVSSWQTMLRIRGELCAIRKIRVNYTDILRLKRMHQTIERLQKLEEREYSILMRILFGLESPTTFSADAEDRVDCSGKTHFVDHSLNDSQKDAIMFALDSPEVALIHGPPGVRF